MYDELDESGGIVLDPLLFDEPVRPEFRARLLVRLEQRRREALGALSRKDWRAFAQLHHPTCRLWSMMACEFSARDEAFHEVLGEIWNSHELNFVDVESLRQVLGPTDFHNHLMTAAERRTLASLDEKITVFRGCRNAFDNHLSWTLNEKTAEFYAELNQGRVICGTVARCNVTAFFERRREDEVIILDAENAVVR